MIKTRSIERYYETHTVEDKIDIKNREVTVISFTLKLIVAAKKPETKKQ